MIAGKEFWSEFFSMLHLHWQWTCRNHVSSEWTGIQLSLSLSFSDGLVVIRLKSSLLLIWLYFHSIGVYRPFWKSSSHYSSIPSILIYFPVIIFSREAREEQWKALEIYIYISLQGILFTREGMEEESTTERIVSHFKQWFTAIFNRYQTLISFQWNSSSSLLWNIVSAK